MSWKIANTVLLLCLLLNVNSQTYNRPIPPGSFLYEFVEHQSPASGYYLATPFKIFNSPASQNYRAPHAMLLDSAGYMAWYTIVDTGMVYSNLNYFDNHNLLTLTKGGAGFAEYYLLNTGLEVLDTFYNVNGVNQDGHEFRILTNGNILIAGSQDSIMDLSSYTFNGTSGSPTTNIRGFSIQEFDPLHNLVFQWNSNEYINPNDFIDFSGFGYNAFAFDYCHGNAIEEDDDGNFLISFRHLNAIYKIDKSNGNVIWVLGGESSDFTFSNDSGFSGQHDIRRLPSGEISLFDNSNSSSPPQLTRCVTYSLDTVNWTATKTWEYFYTPPFYSGAMGSFQSTSNYDLINYGLIFRPFPNMVHLDASGDLISEIIFEDSVMGYRGFYYDIPFNFNRPSIACSQAGSQILLSAPGGYDSYVWSTGDTTSSILISNPGEYQCWVNYGIGMIGSYPITINDVLTDCGLSISDENIDSPYNSSIIGYYNLLGQRIQTPPIGKLYLIRYSNGRTIKAMRSY